MRKIIGKSLTERGVEFLVNMEEESPGSVRSLLQRGSKRERRILRQLTGGATIGRDLLGWQWQAIRLKFLKHNALSKHGVTLDSKVQKLVDKHQPAEKPSLRELILTVSNKLTSMAERVERLEQSIQRIGKELCDQ